ncbi:hypothetical protein OG818_25740 [Streptomyces virginiae]|uniref:hypothetical protein n=1 Tax=Streptomyces virginiae TaxID=1961 RepID=UPI0022551AD1|nr:hypothetical protein [Streptomyces virginiae]MCX4719149.1 hypothetical protein [Streptomyces virginiae]
MTRQTSEALATVGTVAAMRLVALAVVEADDKQASRLRTGVHDAVVGSGVGGRHEVLICTDLPVGRFMHP